jgi:SPP1 family predicted phage head-tail adaptor
MSRPSIASMRLRMTIEAPNDTLDDAGALVRAYSPLATVWAQVTPLSGEARFVASRQEQAIDFLARIRWRSDVTGEMRMVAGTRKLLIHSVHDPDERKRFLLCRCEEIKK